MIRATVLYPASATRFDYEYYINQHIPLVRRTWEPHGLTMIEVSKGLAGLTPGSSPVYAAITVLTFESIQSVHNAMTASRAEILADIPNFTDVEPVAQINEILL